MDTVLTSKVTAALLGENNTCIVSSNSVLSCSAKILADKCHVTFDCENIASTKVTQCSFEMAGVAKAVAGITADLLKNEEQATQWMTDTIAASTAPGPSYTVISDKIQNYITVNCQDTVNSVQSIVCPIMVSDCSNETILAINKLDANATCALTKANDLLQASGLGTRLGATATAANTKKLLIRMILVALLIICGGFVAALFFGFLLRRKVAYQTRLQAGRARMPPLMPMPPQFPQRYHY